MTKTTYEERRGIIAVAIFAMAALGTFLIVHGQQINHDTAWYLVSIERWMHGGEIYRDIFEINPPINFYFTLPVYGLAKATGLSLPNSQYAVTSIMAGGVLAWCYLIASANDPNHPKRHLLLIVMLWAAIIFPAFRHFAQRDHLLFLFLMPWAIGLTFQQDGANGRSGAIRSAFAALGICLKPYFLIFPICATVAVMLRDKSLKPVISASNIVFVLVGACYVGFVALVHPSYFSDIVPIGILTYGDYGFSTRTVIRNIGLLQILFLDLLLLECLRHKTKLVGLPVIVSLFFGGLFSYGLQWTGFTYQAVPAHGFGLVVCAYLIIYASQKPLVRLALLCFVTMLLLVAIGGADRSTHARALINALSENSNVRSISTFSSHVSVGPIVALELGVAWHNRYPALWPVPGIVNAKAEGDCVRIQEDCDALRKLAIRTRENVLEDLQKGRPDVIIFDKQPGYFHVAGFSYEEFLRKSEDLSRFLDRYPRRVRLDRFDILYLEPRF